MAAPPAPPVTSPRPRGRPPKAKDPSSSEVEAKVVSPSGGSGRPRGRPPKKQKTESEAVKADVEPAEEATAPASTGERRGRGRPPKVKPAMVPVGC